MTGRPTPAPRQEACRAAGLTQWTLDTGATFRAALLPRDSELLSAKAKAEDTALGEADTPQSRPTDEHAHGRRPHLKFSGRAHLCHHQLALCSVSHEGEPHRAPRCQARSTES